MKDHEIEWNWPNRLRFHHWPNFLKKIDDGFCKIGWHKWLALYRPPEKRTEADIFGRRYEYTCLHCGKEKVKYYWLL